MTVLIIAVVLLAIALLGIIIWLGFQLGTTDSTLVKLIEARIRLYHINNHYDDEDIKEDNEL